MHHDNDDARTQPDGDEELLALASTYHQPPPAPREELWSRISAARGGASPATVTPLIPRRRPVWLAWPLAAAALVMLGVGLGRWTALQTRAASAVASAAPAAPGTDAASGGTALPAAYRITVEQHLAQSEALLTMVRSAAQRGEVGAYAPETARVLLASNRLLADSPASQDPKLRVLLDDLELVLAQIAQLPSTRAREDLDVVANGIEQGGVLVRLRTAVPSGDAHLPASGAL